MISTELETLRSQYEFYIELQRRWNNYQNSQRKQQPLETQDYLYDQYQEMKVHAKMTIIDYHQRLKQLEANHLKQQRSAKMKEEYLLKKSQQQQVEKEENQMKTLNITQPQQPIRLDDQLIQEEKQSQNQQSDQPKQLDPQLIVYHQELESQLQDQKLNLKEQIPPPQKIILEENQVQNQLNQSNQLNQLIEENQLNQSLITTYNQDNQPIQQQQSIPKDLSIMTDSSASITQQLAIQESLTNTITKSRSITSIKSRLKGKHKLNAALTDLKDDLDKLVIIKDQSLKILIDQIESRYPQYKEFTTQLSSIGSIELLANILQHFDNGQQPFIPTESSSIEGLLENITIVMSSIIYYFFGKQLVPITPQFFLELWEIIIKTIVEKYKDLDQMVEEVQLFVNQSLMFHHIDNATYHILLSMNANQDGEELLTLFYRDKTLTQQQYFNEIMRLSQQLQREQQSQNWYNQKQSEMSQHNQQQIRKWTMTLALESLEAIAESAQPQKVDQLQKLFLRKTLMCLQYYLNITKFTSDNFKIYTVNQPEDGIEFVKQQLDAWNQYGIRIKLTVSKEFVETINQDNEYFKDDFYKNLLKIGSQFLNDANDSTQPSSILAQRPSKLLRYFQNQEITFLKYKQNNLIVKSEYSEQKNQLVQSFFTKLNGIYDALITIQEDQMYQIRLSEEINKNLHIIMASSQQLSQLNNQVNLLQCKVRQYEQLIQIGHQEDIDQVISRKLTLSLNKKNEVLVQISNDMFQSESYKKEWNSKFQTKINDMFDKNIIEAQKKIMNNIQQQELSLQEIQKATKKINDTTSNIKGQLDAKQITKDLNSIETYFKRIPQEWKTIQRFIIDQIDSIEFPQEEIGTTVKNQRKRIKTNFKEIIDQITLTKPSIKQEQIKEHFDSTFRIFSNKILEATTQAQNQDILKQHLMSIHNQLIAIPTYKNIQDIIDKMMNLKVPQQNEQLQDKINQIIKINSEFESIMKILNIKIPIISQQEIQKQITEIQVQINDFFQNVNLVPQSIDQIKQLLRITNQNQQVWESTFQQLSKEILTSDWQEIIKGEVYKQFLIIKEKQQLFEKTTADSINQFLLLNQQNQQFLEKIIGQMKDSESLLVTKKPHVIEIRDSEDGEHKLIKQQKQIINALTKRKDLIAENYFM